MSDKYYSCISNIIYVYTKRPQLLSCSPEIGDPTDLMASAFLTMQISKWAGGIELY